MARSKGGGLNNPSLPGKVLVGVLMMFGLGIAYWVIFYTEISDQIQAQRQLASEKKIALRVAKEAQAAYTKDLAEKARREGLARKQKKILPDDAEMPAFLSTVQTVATISGIELNSWTPLDESPAKFYAKVPMQLKLDGKFHQIAKFFHGIGQVDRIINMENIMLTVSKEKESSDGGLVVRVRCLATAFRALKASTSKRNRRGNR
jgi:type IV pilus assembly protein PilO